MNSVSTLPQPINIPVSNKEYKLVFPYEYTWEHDKNTYRLTIPNGFKYDGASSPRIFWTLTGLRPDGLIRAAATVHDYLYHHKGELPLGCLEMQIDGVIWTPLAFPWSRNESDRMLGRLMREAGVPKIQRRLAYLAVHLAGRFYWK